MSHATRKLTAIMFTDIVGFTDLTANDEAEALMILQWQRKTFQPLITEHGGEWLKEVGDGLLLSFSSSQDAVQCAARIQDAAEEKPNLKLRIGIHQGDIIQDGADIMGDGVNMASRIEAVAPAGGIAFSEKVQQDISGYPEFEMVSLGEYSLKGVPLPVTLFCLAPYGLPKIPEYKLLRRTGAGAYGEVWLAQTLTGVHRAVKIVRRNHFDDDTPYDREFNGITKYEPVSRKSEGLIDLFHVGSSADGDFFYYVMELADSQRLSAEINISTYQPKTLESELETRGKLALEECLESGKRLAQSLAFLHSHNLVHRDIKPANIIFVDGLPKLADIGLVTSTDNTSTLVGTMGYIPPEGPGKFTSDIYALGKVLYQMCTGMDCQMFPDLPSGFDGMEHPFFRRLNSIYLRACEYNPELRYPDATGILEALSSSEDPAECTISPDLTSENSAEIIILDHEGAEIARVPLNEGEYMIGREGYGNAISVDDKSVSRKHAKLIITNGQVEIEDLKSTYGISKEGQQISGRIPVHPGEKIGIGRHFIHLDGGAETIAPAVEEKPILGSGRYGFIKKLGQGTFGEVWHMWDNELNEDVAVKLLTEDMVNESAVSDFKREVQKTRRMSHDNIVRIFDLCALPGEPPFLTMEFVDGHSLETQRLNRSENRFSWRELQPLIDQLCNAVSYIHEKGIVHRDIKPSNILITNEQQVKLGDFGCARSMIISRFTMGQFAEQGNVLLSGTLVYMSPQMLEGGEPVASDDIYAIGAMLYELLTGQTPFSCSQSQENLMDEILNVKPSSLEQVFEHQGTTCPIPNYVSDMIMSCLDKDPTKRPGKAGLITTQFYY